jgi:transcriptional regulator with XRE-family HTH domain
VPTFSEVFKNLRTKNGWTQEEIANKLGVSRPSIAGYESKDRIPRREMLNKIADVFGVSIDFLLGRTTEEGPSREEEQPDPDKIVAEKLLSYLHQGFTNEEIKKRMDFILDVFTLNDEKSDEWIDFVREQLIKQKRLVPPHQDVKS